MHHLFPSSSANGLRARSAGAPGASQAGDPGGEGPAAEEEVRALGRAGPRLLPSPGLLRPAGPFLKHRPSPQRHGREAGLGLTRARRRGLGVSAEQPAESAGRALTVSHQPVGMHRRSCPESRPLSLRLRHRAEVPARGWGAWRGGGRTRRSRGAWEAAQWRDTVTLLSPSHKTPAA